MTNAALRGKPDAGNPHVPFDEGEVASAPRRGSLLYSIQKTSTTAVLVVAAFVVVHVFAAATSNEGGEYPYSGTPKDNRTTGQTGNQTYTVDSPITISGFWPGQTDVVECWQIYKGASITDSGQARLMMGNVVFENAVNWLGTENYIGYTGPAKLVLRNGGTLTVTNDDLRIGQKHDNDYPNTHGGLFVEGPSALTVVGKNAVVGNTRPGALWMDGGTISVTNGILQAGCYASQDGYIRINDGEVSLGAGDADFLNIGSAGNYSSLHISGGTLSTRRPSSTTKIYGKVGMNANKAADVYVDGGLLDLWNEVLGIGRWTTSTGGRASLTIDGDGRVVSYLLAMGTQGSGNVSVVNLNGGRLELTRGLTDYANHKNGRSLNFDGGTLALVRHPGTSSYTGALGNVCSNVVYPGGANIEVPSGISADISATFRQATGYGVSAITLVNPGAGYVTAPKVTISGGSGTGASAYAVMNRNRTIDRIVVTCRGEGYAAGDIVTVTIDSATGSGATATAALAPNAGGVVRKTGAGTWRQQTNDNTFDGAIEVAEGTLALDGVGFPSASALRMGNGAGLKPVRGTTYCRLDVTNGVAQIAADGSSGTATLNLGSLSVTQGLALVTHTNGLGLVLAATDLTETSSSASPVVNGLVYANKDVSSYRQPLPMVRQGDGSLAPAETSTTPGADVNWRPGAAISEADAPAVDAVNGIVMPLSPGVECYVKNSGLIDVKSGMIVVQRPNEGIVRMNVTGGGAFTTRAKGGMFIYGDNYKVGNRSNSTANDNAVNVGNWKRLFGPFADPDGSTPMALTVAGEKQSRPEFGAQAWLLGVQAFSGGLNLVNGGVFVQADSGLGASGSPVRASGYCSVSAYNWAFDVAHPFVLLDGSALVFSPSAATGNTVSGALSGSGDLLTSDVNRPGCAMAFTGDHSSFAGDYYVHGNARIAPAVFSALAGIKLADGTNGVGVVETSGSFTRSAGTGKGEVCWKRFEAYSATYGLRGGFSAYGGDLTVNLGGEGAKLSTGSDYLPDGAVVQLQSQYADGELTLENGFELGGKTQKVNVWAGKTATLSGAVSDAVGGGALSISGDIAFAGTLEVSAANLSADAPLLSVDGALAFAEGAVVSVAGDVNDDDLLSLGCGDIVLASATGAITGVPTLVAPSIGAEWTLKVSNGKLWLKKPRGMAIIFR